MPPLPPPPLPPAPPPPPPLNSSLVPNGPPKMKKSEQVDRNALLSQIRHGTKLKTTAEINDRSAPIIGKTNDQTNTAVRKTNGVQNGPSSVPMQLGGLFAQGMPVLRSTGSKISSNESKIPEKNTEKNNQSLNKFSNTNSNIQESISSEIKSQKRLQQSSSTSSSTSTIKASLEQQLNFNNPNKSFLFPTTGGTDNTYSNSNKSNQKYNTINLSKLKRDRADQTNSTKGLAPSVPINHSKPVPPLPSKPPSVHRSNSQSLNKNTARTGPTRPTIPPPKPSDGSYVRTQPQVPKKPPDINRRQSFGGRDMNHLAEEGLTTTTETDSSTPVSITPSFRPSTNNFLKPNPPPRHNSVPNGLNQQSHQPIPPPTSTIPFKINKPVMQVNPTSHMHRTAPASPKPAVCPLSHVQRTAPTSPRPTVCPPPPPPHKSLNSSINTSNYNENSSSISWSSNCSSDPPPPPNQTRVLPCQGINKKSPDNDSIAPALPVRNVSLSKQDFESRFRSHFKEIHHLPAPEPFLNTKKTYPSEKKPRGPAPPVPNQYASNHQNTNAHHNSINNANFMHNSTPVLHVKLEHQALGTSRYDMNRC